MKLYIIHIAIYIVNYPPTPKAMGWASEVIDSPNGNALLRFCLMSDSIPEPDSIFKPCFLIFILALKSLSCTVLHPSTLRKQYWYQHLLWSDGYFVCSIGEASPDTIRDYILSQG